MEMRKVPASAGAEWLLATFRLLKRSPAGFGALGAIYAGLWLAIILAATAAPGAALPLQMVMMLMGPLLLAGMIFAAHEVDHGGGATPAHLMAAFRTGKAGRVITTLIPQVLVLLVCMLLLVAIVGMDNLDRLAALMTKLQAEAQKGGQVDPALFADLPAGRMLLWLLLVLVIGVFSTLLTLTVIPDMLFGDVGLVAAMKRSFGACLRNAAAVIVFLVLGMVVLFAAAIGLGLVVGTLGLILGDAAVLVGQAITNGFFACFLSGAMYHAWKGLLGPAEAGTGAPTAPPTGVAM
jgi:hypothetical protein